jgi:hypothetical protein
MSIKIELDSFIIESDRNNYTLSEMWIATKWKNEWKSVLKHQTYHPDIQSAVNRFQSLYPNSKEIKNMNDLINVLMLLREQNARIIDYLQKNY